MSINLLVALTSAPASTNNLTTSPSTAQCSPAMWSNFSFFCWNFTLINVDIGQPVFPLRGFAVLTSTPAAKRPLNTCSLPCVTKTIQNAWKYKYKDTNTNTKIQAAGWVPGQQQRWRGGQVPRRRDQGEHRPAQVDEPPGDHDGDHHDDHGDGGDDNECQGEHRPAQVGEPPGDHDFDDRDDHGDIMMIMIVKVSTRRRLNTWFTAIKIFVELCNFLIHENVMKSMQTACFWQPSNVVGIFCNFNVMCGHVVQISILEKPRGGHFVQLPSRVSGQKSPSCVHLLLKHNDPLLPLTLSSISMVWWFLFWAHMCPSFSV